jgi:hypothetical protein
MCGGKKRKRRKRKRSRARSSKGGLVELRP